MSPKTRRELPFPSNCMMQKAMAYTYLKIQIFCYRYLLRNKLHILLQRFQYYLPHPFRGQRFQNQLCMVVVQRSITQLQQTKEPSTSTERFRIIQTHKQRVHILIRQGRHKITRKKKNKNRTALKFTMQSS